MVGTVEKGRTLYALEKTPEKDIYQVRQGNYLGQNYGVVIGISDADIKLKELVQDGAGDWSERSSALNLLPTEKAQGSKR
jgi:type IV pilus assembly protein PilP